MEDLSLRLRVFFYLCLAFGGLLIGFQNCAKPNQYQDTSPTVSDANSCTACHGNEHNSAPPKGVHHQFETTDIGVGAHQAHVLGGDLSTAIDCTQCHIKPASILEEGHIKNQPARIAWGDLAKSGGANPKWERSIAGCSSTYCHGSLAKGGVATEPIWTRVDGSQKTCTSCHGFPPPAPHPQRTNCSACHAATVDANGAIVHKQNHVNGVIDGALSCNSCHGSSANAAPPFDTNQQTDTALLSVGAHQQHLNSIRTKTIECSECHNVPTHIDDPGHILGQRARVVLGPRSNRNGVQASYNATTGTCTTACHGENHPSTFGGVRSRPVWNHVDGSQSQCSSCHAQPTGDTPLAKHSGQNCGTCHAGYSATSVDANTHIDGTTDATSAKNSCRSCHTNVNVTNVLHPAGIAGSPLENVSTSPSESCVICHMPKGIHLFRANTSSVYSTYNAGIRPGEQLANTASDGTHANTAWVDVDMVCGQCHGGGNAFASSQGSIVSGSKILNVTSNSGFAVSERVTIAGAGPEKPDGSQSNLETFVSQISGTQITLAHVASNSVTAANVIQNPTRNNASWKSKSTLAHNAVTFHSGAYPGTSQVSFSYALGNPNTLILNTTVTTALCAAKTGGTTTCNRFDWDWGDGSPHSTGESASHTYSTAGNYKVTVVAENVGISGATRTTPINVYKPDYPPTINGTCDWNADTWTMTVQDSSTDDNGIRQVSITWGDGGAISTSTTYPFGPLSHTYIAQGSYTLTHKVLDTIGQQATKTCLASPTYFSIAGVVTASNGTTPISSATVVLTSGSTTRTLYSSSSGSFSANNLKPGNWTVTVSKSGYTFAQSAIQIGPNKSDLQIKALTP